MADKAIPLNISDLLHQKSIEQTRLEFKESWNEVVKKSTINTICAYANDFLNLNGGYIIIGVKTDQNGNAILPPTGLNNCDLDKIQREIVGNSKGFISPEYIPIVQIEEFQGQSIVIIWAPAGDNRPYEAPKRDRTGTTYYIRSGSSSIEATGDLKRQLLEQAAKIPYDSRRNLNSKVEDISLPLVKQFLIDIRSYLANNDLSIEAHDTYRKLHLTIPINNHEVPRNVALLFFNESPEMFFEGAFIEVVQFGDDAGGDLIEERKFVGPLAQQIKSCLNYLEGLGGSLLQKIPGRAEVERTFPYPYQAMEEAIVNAIYHRGYDFPPEPTKVYLYPDRMEIISYPGPMPGIKLEHFDSDNSVPPVPARNRRIGEFLKELRLAERRGTGIPKIIRIMKENGSPQAIFDFDEDRTYFRVKLPVHPRYQALHAIRESAHLWAAGKKSIAISHLHKVIEKQPGSGAIASQIIEYSFKSDDPDLAQNIFDIFQKQEKKSETLQPYLTMARCLIDINQNKKAQHILDNLPPFKTDNDLKEADMLIKKIGAANSRGELQI